MKREHSNSRISLRQQQQQSARSSNQNIIINRKKTDIPSTNLSRNRWRSSSVDSARNLSRGVSPASSINSLNSNYSSSSKRFNPTEYVKAKKEKVKDIEMRRFTIIFHFNFIIIIIIIIIIIN